MELKDEIIGKLAEPLIEEVKYTISEEERKRKSLPKIQLEADTLAHTLYKAIKLGYIE